MKKIIIIYILAMLVSCSGSGVSKENIISNLREDCFVPAKEWEFRAITNIYNGSNSMKGFTAIQILEGQLGELKGNPACMTLCAEINYPWDVYWDAKRDEYWNKALELDRIVPQGIRGKSPFQIGDKITMVNDCTIQDMNGGLGKNQSSLLEHALLYDPRKFKGTVYEVRLIRNGKPMILKFPKE